MKWIFLGAAMMPFLIANANANSVEGIDYTTHPGGKIVVKVSMKDPIDQPPASFVSKSPPRITLDFPNATNNLAKRSFQVGDGVLRSISSAQANNRTRVVLNLSTNSAYNTSLEGNNVLITLQGTGSAATADSAVTHFSKAAAGMNPNAITNIDFQRGKDGEGRVIVDLEQPGGGIDIRQQGKTLVVDFMNSSIPEELERRLNVTNFATPVLSVDSFKQGGNARVVIEPKGIWEHAAYQTERQFIVEIKPVSVDSKKAVPGPKGTFGGEKLSLDFNGIDVKSLLKIIGDFTGKNIVVSDAVQGTITLRLKDVPWDQALDIILKQKQLGMDNLGNTLVFAPKAEIAARQKEAQDQENQIDEIKPLVTQAFQIKYQKASDIKTLISDPKQPLLSKRGTAVVDTVTNTLFVKDNDNSLAKIQEILNQVDIPARQVLIEARIVNADESFSKSLGVKFGITHKGGAGTMGHATTGNVGASQDLATGKTTVGENQDLNVNLPASSATGAAVSAIALTLFKLPAGFLLNLELSAAEADGKTKVISSPRVITMNGTKASFDFGEDIPYTTVQSGSNGAGEPNFKKATLGIQVTPQITPDDRIGMDIDVTNDSRGANTTAGPIINTNKVSTKVLVDNGETAVLGGFYKETKSNSTESVPFFGALPVFGPLFRSNSAENRKQEILFFITPKIMSDTMKLN